MKTVLQNKFLLFATMMVALVRFASAQSISYVEDFDLSNLQTFSGTFLDIRSEQGIPEGITFSPDGYKLFVSGQSAPEVNQYSLTDPFNVQSGVTHDGLYSVTEYTRVYGIYFSNDGHEMFVTGTSGNELSQYHLTTAFDITGEVTFSASYNLPAGDPHFIVFNDVGTKMYIKFGANISQYSLSTGFDISSTVLLEGSYSVGYVSEEMLFTSDGKTMLVVELSGDVIHQYSLTTPFEITTGVTDDAVSFDVSGEETYPHAMAISSDDSRLFILGGVNTNVYQYNMSIDGFTESLANNGEIDGAIPIIISGETFTNQGSSFTEGVHYSIENMPENLSHSISVASDGESATLTLSGTVAAHQEVNDVSALEIVFENSAFTGNDASAVFNSDGMSSTPGINFTNNKLLTYGNAYNLSQGATYDLSYSVASRQPSPRDVTFSSDGMTMFTVGADGNPEINQYSLSSPFNLGSSVAYEAVRTVSAEESLPLDVAFSNDGLSMFIVGLSNEINEYELTTPFSIVSGVTPIAAYSTPSGVQSIVFSANGKKLFLITDYTSNLVYQYTLSTPYNVASKGTHDGVFDVTSQDSAPLGLTFNASGTQMFVAGKISNTIFQYSLSNSFDITGGVTYEGISLDVTDVVSNPSGVFFSNDGSRLFISDMNGQYDISQYSISTDGFQESQSNTGSVAGFLTVQITNDYFTGGGTSLTHGVDYTVTNMPAGLSPDLAINSNGTIGTLTFAGSASDNQDANDITAIEISFENSAFVSGDVSDIFGVNESSNTGIDFRDNNPSISYGNGFDVNYAFFSKKEPYSIIDRDNDATGITMSSDGMKFYLVGNSGDAIYQYSTVSPFELDGMTYDEVMFDISSEDVTPTGIAFSPDGTKMFTTGADEDEINQYTLGTPFDLSGTVTHNIAFSVADQDGYPQGLTFNPSGTKMYMVGTSGDRVYQYALNSAFDLTGAVSYEGSISVLNEEANPGGLAFSKDGLRLLVIGSLGDEVNQYLLAAPFDITYGVEFDTNFRMSQQDQGPTDLIFNPSGTKIFVLGLFSDAILEYSIDKGGFVESAFNEGSVVGSLDIFLNDQFFVNAGSSLEQGTHYSISNLPTGLALVLNVAADGFSSSLSLTGNAVNHQDVDDLTGLIISFEDAAFSGGNAAIVANATSFNTETDIDYRDNNPAVFYGEPLNLAEASYSGSSVNISTQDGYATGLAFSNDGMKMYIAGNDNYRVFEYSLSQAYDLSSTVTYTESSLDISANASSPEDIYFSKEGTRLFLLSNDNYEVVQYNLSTAYDLTTAAYSGNSFSVASQDESAYGFTFSPDGSKMYLSGGDDYAIYQYSLTTPFELSTASFDEVSFNIENEEGDPSGIVLSQDGRYMIVVGDNEGSAVRYRLSIPFDLSAGASYDGTTFDLSNEDAYPSGVTASPDGSRLFVIGYDLGLISQYNITLGGFTEAAANDGSIEGSAVLSIIDDTFTSGGGILTHGVDYNINNLPPGLTATLDVAADGYSATVTLTGNSNTHGNIDDIEGLQFHFQNSAFSNYAANDVENVTNFTTDLGIDYLPYTENDISTFTFPEISGSELIFTETHKVTAEAVAGTDISAITPTITVSREATISPDTGVEQDFTSAFIYTVTAEDGTPQDWEVTISEKLAAPTDILLSNNVIDENVAQGTLVGTLSTIDASFADAHSYTFASGSNDNESFDIINGNELVTAEMLDYEESSEWLVDVMTDDGNGGTFTKQLVINLNDINETPTDLLLSNNAVDESSSIGTLVGTLTSTDEDSGDMHIYSFKSGIADNDAFDIDGDKLITAEVLDFETQSVYNLELVTTDQGGLTYEKVIVVNVNDLPAQITSIEISNTVINENTSIGTLVGTFATFGEALSGSFTYNIIPGSGDDDHASFSISGDQLLVASSFDFESQESYTIVVMSDDGNLTDEQEFTISVIDVPDAPTDILLSAGEVAENNGTGEVVGLLSTVDQDTGESHTYELVTGEGDTDNISFSINGNELRTAAVYDFETQASYSVRIETNDGNRGTYQEVFTITILNENESIIVANPIADQSLDEGFETTEIDLSAVFVDQDSDALTYEVSSSNTEAVTVSNTGATLTIAEVGLGTSIVTVTADDGSGITTSDEFTVVVNDVNDAPTDILLSANEVAENNSIGDVVGLLSTTDPDAGASHTYALVPGEDDTDNAAFSINENELRAAAVYDFETKSSYKVRIETNDGNGGTYQEVFTITILNENEAPIVVDPFVDQTNLIEGFVDAQINYADVFSDDDGDELTITVSSSNLAVVTVSVISNNQIHIDEVGLGTSTITVTANDGRGGSVSDEFIITVNRALSSANDIITFSVEGQISTSIIDEINHTISLTVSASSDITNLSPELSISDLATINPTSGSSQNFSSNVVYTVAAENGDAQDWTVTVDQMKTQTLSIESIGEKTYGSSPFEMQAEASSQLEVSFELIDGGNAVTLQGSTITVIGAGSFTVKASQSGNAEYEAQSVQQTFSIQKAPLTVTADNKSRVFGEENPELTLQYAGFVNGDEQTDLSEKPIVTTSAVATSNVGEYDIEVTGGTAANYEIQTVNGVLTISKATAMITLSDLEQDADGSAKIPTVTTDPAGLSHTITYDGSVDAPSEAGTYNVVVTIDEDNYAGEQTASFTINGIATGVEDLALEYKVYPNPAKNWLKIENSGFEELTIRMYNLDGQLVLSENLTSIHTNLDISDLNNGMYLLSLNTKQYSTTTRILINR